MSDAINIVQFVRDLPSRPRGRAAFLLTHDYQGQKEWAAELARQTGAEHLDMLELFSQDKALAEKTSEFLVPTLFEFLKGRSNTPVLIVSGLEFIKATWSGQPTEVDEFASRVEWWDRKPCLLFVIQYDRTIATREYRRFPQYAFVIDQKETLAL